MTDEPKEDPFGHLLVLQDTPEIDRLRVEDFVQRISDEASDVIRTPIEVRRDESGEVHVFRRGVEQLFEIKTGPGGEYLFLNGKPVGPVIKPTEPD